MSMDVAESWAFGPQGGTTPRRGWRPFGTVAGVFATLGLAAAIGFVAFVMIAGRGNAPSRAEVAGGVTEPATVAEIDAPTAVAATQPFEVTDILLTDAVDAATGEPGSSTYSFGIGEPVNLWLSFDAGDATAGSLTAIWFRGERRIARVEAPLPDGASQMVFPLPQVAVDRPGDYGVEVWSNGDVLAAESFEVTDG